MCKLCKLGFVNYALLCCGVLKHGQPELLSNIKGLHDLDYGES